MRGIKYLINISKYFIPARGNDGFAVDAPIFLMQIGFSSVERPGRTPAGAAGQGLRRGARAMTVRQRDGKGTATRLRARASTVVEWPAMNDAPICLIRLRALDKSS